MTNVKESKKTIFKHAVQMILTLWFFSLEQGYTLFGRNWLVRGGCVSTKVLDIKLKNTSGKWIQKCARSPGT